MEQRNAHRVSARTDKNLDNQVSLGRRKNIDCQTVLLAIEANPVCNTHGVLGELSISQSSFVYPLQETGKSPGGGC